MANVFANPTLIARESVRALENAIVTPKLVHRQYVKEFTGDTKTGGSVTIKAPVYARVKNGATLNEVDIAERSFTLTVGTRRHVGYILSSQEYTMNLQEFTETVIKPSMVALANDIERELLSTVYKKIPQQVGTPGTTPSSYRTFAQARQKLMENGYPQGDPIHGIINSAAVTEMSNTIQALFHREIVGDAITKAKLPPIAGIECYESQNVPMHTVGTWAADSGAAQKDGSSTDGDTTLALKTITAAATVKAGDMFEIAGTYAVNPITGQSTGVTRQFVATTDTAATNPGGTIAALACIPGTSPYNIRSETQGEQYLPYQNLYTLPAGNALLTIAGTSGLQHPVNVAFHKNAFALVTVPLEMPDSVVWKTQMNYKGINIRVIKDYNSIYDYEYIRFDVFFGTDLLDPHLACRIAG